MHLHVCVLLQKIINSDLESFIFSLTAFIQILIFARLLTSKSIVSFSSTVRFGLNYFTMECSLANLFRLRLESITLLIVLLYILNKFAPEHQPWGTKKVRSFSSEYVLPIIIFMFVEAK